MFYGPNVFPQSELHQIYGQVGLKILQLSLRKFDLEYKTYTLIISRA